MSDVQASVEVIEVQVAIEEVVTNATIVEQKEIISRQDVVEIAAGTGDTAVDAGIQEVAVNVNLQAVGPPSISEDDVAFARRVDFSPDGNLIYRGEANPGTLDSQPLWRIRRITITPPEDDTVEKWANGNGNFTNIWDNRLSLTYI